jgi:RNA polymerase sigma-70 factor (ECF subfamily)
LLAVDQHATHPAPSGNLERIFHDHHSRVFAAAFRVTGSAQDAEDVVQTVFLRLLRRQGELDLSPSPGSYLHRASVNASLDLLRARSRSGSIPMDDLDVLPTDRADTNPDRRQEDREVRRGVRQALLTLSPKNAEIFALRFLEGLPNREIATSYGMTQTAVGVALHRARHQVKKELNSFLGGA